MADKTIESNIERARGNALALVGMLEPKLQLELWEGIAKDLDRSILDSIGGMAARSAKKDKASEKMTPRPAGAGKD